MRKKTSSKLPKCAGNCIMWKYLEYVIGTNAKGEKEEKYSVRTKILKVSLKKLKKLHNTQNKDLVYKTLWGVVSALFPNTESFGGETFCNVLPSEVDHSYCTKDHGWIQLSYMGFVHMHNQRICYIVNCDTKHIVEITLKEGFTASDLPERYIGSVMAVYDPSFPQDEEDNSTTEDDSD